VNRGYVKNTG